MNAQPPVPTTLAPAPFLPSRYQAAIYDAIGDTTSRSNILIEAVAGSGKTTTIVNAVGLLPPAVSRIFLAFNRAIADELTGRGVPGSTFHALGLNAARPFLSTGFRIEGSKCFSIFRNIVAKQLHDDYSEVPRLVGLGKNYGIGLFSELPNIAANWLELIDYHDLTFPDNNKAAEFAGRILGLSVADRATIDFDDMLYLPLLFGASFRQFDFIFVDEAQDLNGIQRAILWKLAHPTSRFIFVGDRHQAIYGFRGAGTDSMSVIAAEFHATSFPLSVSYRCPRAVVEFAQRYVSQILPSDTAIAGAVTPAAPWRLADLPDNSAVICRNTRPIIRLAYGLLREGRRVQVLGRDIGASFKSLLKRVKTNSREELVVKLVQMMEIETEKERARGATRKAAAISDKFDSLFAILEAIDPGVAVADIPKHIDKLFADQPGAIQLATVHKAKGLEWDHVAILDFARLMPSQYATDGWQLEQEYNLIYVAVTRAKNTLAFINTTDLIED